MGMFDAEELDDLRHHYRGAYVISGSDDVWAATRTDTGETLFARSAEALRERIRADYAAKPVPRPAADTGRLARKFGP